MTLFLHDISSLEHAIKVLDDFKLLSGLTLNRSKTEIFPIGNQSNDIFTLYKMKWEKYKVYALRTWFYKDHHLSITETYNARLKIMEAILDSWSCRHLSLLGRITVIKSMCLSKLTFATAE